MEKPVVSTAEISCGTTGSFIFCGGYLKEKKGNAIIEGKYKRKYAYIVITDESQRNKRT